MHCIMLSKLSLTKNHWPSDPFAVSTVALLTFRATKVLIHSKNGLNHTFNHPWKNNLLYSNGLNINLNIAAINLFFWKKLAALYCVLYWPRGVKSPKWVITNLKVRTVQPFLKPTRVDRMFDGKDHTSVYLEFLFIGGIVDQATESWS